MRLQLQEKLDCDLTERKKEVDELVMEVIDEQTQEDEEDAEDEEDESDSDEEPSKMKKKTKPVSRKKAASESGSDYSPEGSDDEDEVPSDGGGSDYEPDEPVGRGGGRGRAKFSKKKTRRDSDDDSSGEEWGGRKKSSASKKSRKRKDSSDDDDSDYEKPKPKRTNKGGGKGNGYTAPVKLSSELADIVGGEEMPRHEVKKYFDNSSQSVIALCSLQVVKRMWQYIKENKLQDPKNKQFIKCDEKLSKVKAKIL